MHSRVLAVRTAKVNERINAAVLKIAETLNVEIESDSSLRVKDSVVAVLKQREDMANTLEKIADALTTPAAGGKGKKAKGGE